MDRRPTKLAAELASVYGVPSIMAGTVLNPINKVFVFAHCFKNELENFEIAAFAIGSDKIGLPDLPFGQNEPNSTSVVIDMNPIAYVQTVPVQFRTLPAPDACNRMRNELLRVLIWTIVITAIRNCCLQTIGTNPSPHKHVRCRLGA